MPRLSLARDTRGATAVEFAIVSPVLFMLLLGGFDVAHTLYMRAALQGIVQKVARDSTLEVNATDAAQTALDNKVRGSVLALNNSARITFQRRFFRTFADAAAGKAEPWTDTDKDKTCDNGEPFEDDNNNGVWDPDGGDSGQGGAVDRALYTVTVSYPRMFPAFKFVGPPITTVQAVTILENQPYDDQGTYAAPTVGHCT